MRFSRFSNFFIQESKVGIYHKMTKEVAGPPKDCLGCRLVGAAGMCGIGAYLANCAWKNKTFPGKLTLSTLSLAFVSLGVARYKQTYPFEKREASAFNKKEIKA